MSSTVPVVRTCVTTRIRTLLCADGQTQPSESNSSAAASESSAEASPAPASSSTSLCCPPTWIHPPVFQWQTYPFISLLVHFVIYLAAQAILQLMAGSAVWISSDKELPLTTHNASAAASSSSFLLLLSELIALSIIGYSFVSASSMQRGIWHACCSRYGSSGELLKLVALVPCLLVFGGLVFLLRRRNPGEYSQCTSPSSDLLWEALGLSDSSLGGGGGDGALHSPDGMWQMIGLPSAASIAAAAAPHMWLIPSQSLPITFLISYFVGLHFTYLDSNAFLQSLGCKLPVPSLWKLFTRNEIIFCVCFAFIVVGASVPIIIQLVLCESILFLLVSYLLLFFAVILLADCTRTQQVRLPSSLTAANTSSNGFLKMHGVEMWRWKLFEITNGLIPPPSRSQSEPADESPTTPVSPPAPIYFHLHHYIFGIFLLPLFRFPDSYSCLIGSGLCFAVLVEGVACWGMDPLLVMSRPIEPPHEEQPSDIVQATSSSSSSSTIATVSSEMTTVP